MQKEVAPNEVKLNLLITITLVAMLMWNLEPPHEISDTGYKLFLIFLMTISCIITSALPMGVITLFAITAISLFNVLPLSKALSGFSHPIAWLVLMAFFIARSVMKTNLGKRIAYILIAKLGKSSIGLSYSLLLTEYILAPMIPSTSARGGGIIYPIAKSLANQYDEIAGGKKSHTGAFLIATAFHGNVICCALFLTAMAGNPLLVTIAKGLGVDISWTTWATAASVPGILNLILLPILTFLLIRPERKGSALIIQQSKDELIKMGRLTSHEKITIATFILLLGLWIFGNKIGVDATTAAFIGLGILLTSQVLDWQDITTEKTAWDTYFWFAVLLMMSENLTIYKVDTWLGSHLSTLSSGMPLLVTIAVLILLYFYSHYFFASVTAHITVLFSIFLILILNTGIPPVLAALLLAFLSNISAGLTHYGINTGPIFFSAGYFTTTQWLKIGLIIATFNLLIWMTVGSVWWKIVGLW